jgi:hypothetical protein
MLIRRGSITLMPKVVMVSGPHAIGKSETCTKLVEKHPEYNYIGSFAGEIAKKVGYDLNSNPSAKDTLAYQWQVLRRFQSSFEDNLGKNTLYDRSPLDFAAYAILQLENNEDKDIKLELGKYVKECLDTTKGYCELLVIPEADFDAPYDDKVNRPSFDKNQSVFRQNYMKVLRILSWQLDWIKVEIVPVRYQYDDRVQFISDLLNNETD